MVNKLKLNHAVKAAIMCLLWVAALFMIFCDSDVATLEDLLLVKIVGFAIAWVLLKRMKIL